MELETVQDLDERMALIKAEVQADMADREAQALDAAAEAITVKLPSVGWLRSGPVTPAFEGRARVFLLAIAALPVLGLVLALILAA